MLHALIYHGSFELNYPALKPGATRFVSTGGGETAIASPPVAVDGVVIGYMERTGKKFFAVRVAFDEHDVVLGNPVALDQMRHMGNRRFSARPIQLDDEHMSVLLDDLLAQNPAQHPELALLVNRVNHVRRGERESIE